MSKPYTDKSFYFLANNSPFTAHAKIPENTIGHYWDKKFQSEAITPEILHMASDKSFGLYYVFFFFVSFFFFF